MRARVACGVIIGGAAPLAGCIIWFSAASMAPSGLTAVVALSSVTLGSIIGSTLATRFGSLQGGFAVFHPPFYGAIEGQGLPPLPPHPELQPQLPLQPPGGQEGACRYASSF